MLELLTLSGGKPVGSPDVISMVPEYLYIELPDVLSVSMVPEYLYVTEPDILSISMVPEYLYVTE